MMRFVYLPSLGALGWMVLSAGGNRNSAQQALLIAGIVLTFFNTLILMLCSDVWRELYDYIGMEGME